MTVNVRKLMLVLDLLDTANVLMQESNLPSEETYELHNSIEDLREEVAEAIARAEDPAPVVAAPEPMYEVYVERFYECAGGGRGYSSIIKTIKDKTEVEAKQLVATLRQEFMDDCYVGSQLMK